jgi:glutamine synthetase
VNGSGKHNNWGLSTNDGINLLDPGSTPQDNEQFLLFLCALIRAVDMYAGLLRASTANPGNEHRLGAHEAPPAIVSVFLGDELTDILYKIAKGEKAEKKEIKYLTIGVDTLPPLPRDNTDRNRTSPFTFSCNKFEFRMVPSSASISEPMMVLNTIVAQTLEEIVTRLKNTSDLNKEASTIIKEIINNHGRIIFNGNNYSDDWMKEALHRGLKNITSSVEALKAYVSKESLHLFDTYKVLSKDELYSRYEVYLDLYAKQINIEAKTCLAMVRREYLPCTIHYLTDLSKSIRNLKVISAKTTVQEHLFSTISGLLESVYSESEKLEKNRLKASGLDDVVKRAKTYSDDICPVMERIREYIDTLEELIPKNLWPVPSYSDMMFHI